MLTKLNRKVVQVLLLVLIISCNVEEKQKEIIVAEVGNSKLTEKQLNQLLELNSVSTDNKDEIIRDWAETELLYQAAKENKLLKRNNFHSIIKQSERKLAASYAMLDYLKNNQEDILKEDLSKYYNTHKNDYILPTNAYITNYISFNNREDAIKFRSASLTQNWLIAKRQIKDKTNIIKTHFDKLLLVSEIQSKKMLRVLKELRKKEISIVIETELSNFVVVQLIDKLKKSEVPKLKYIKDEVKTVYKAQSNNQLIRNYINKLTSQKNVKIY